MFVVCVFVFLCLCCPCDELVIRPKTPTVSKMIKKLRNQICAPQWKRAPKCGARGCLHVCYLCMAYARNFAVECSVFGRRQLDTNLDPKIGYPDSSFVVFFTLTGKLRDCTSNYIMTSSFHIVYNSLLIIHLSFDATLYDKLRGFSSEANYTDRVTAACRRS
jgi:hypothetical protein